MTRFQKYSALIAFISVAGFVIVSTTLRMRAAGQPLRKNPRTGEWEYTAEDFVKRLRYDAVFANATNLRLRSVSTSSYEELTNWIQPSEVRSLLKYRDCLRLTAGVS